MMSFRSTALRAATRPAVAAVASRAPTKALTPSATTALRSFSSSNVASSSDKDPSKTVVVVDGIRLPFAMSSTIYSDQLGVDLQRLAFKGLIDKTAISKEDIDYVIAGTVIQEVRTSNIAREAAINAGLPDKIGAHTVAMVSMALAAVVCHDKWLLIGLNLCTNFTHTYYVSALSFHIIGMHIIELCHLFRR